MSLIQRPGRPTWYCRAKIQGGTFTLSAKTTNRTEARRFHAEVFLPEVRKRRHLALLQHAPLESLPNLDNAIVREVSRLETDVSAREAERARQCLTNFAKWAGAQTLIETIADEHLADYQRHRVMTVSARTARLELMYVHRLLRLNGHPRQCPRPIPGRRTPNRAFTKEELGKFFKACPERWQTLFLTLLSTGARPAELVPSPQSSHIALLREEVNPETASIIIRSAKRHPGSPARSCEITVSTDLARRILEEAPVPGRYAFAAPGIGLNHVFEKILKKAGIPKHNVLNQKLTSHSFRHTHATLLRAAGVPLEIVQQQLGHSSITTTQIYNHHQGTAPVIDIGNLVQKAG